MEGAIADELPEPKPHVSLPQEPMQDEQTDLENFDEQREFVTSS
jgi:hypothetical protein